MRVAFAAVSMMEAEALHDYASEEGGVLLRAATQDRELARHAQRTDSRECIEARRVCPHARCGNSINFSFLE